MSTLKQSTLGLLLGSSVIFAFSCAGEISEPGPSSLEDTQDGPEADVASSELRWGWRWRLPRSGGSTSTAGNGGTAAAPSGGTGGTGGVSGKGGNGGTAAAPSGGTGATGATGGSPGGTSSGSSI